MESVKEADVRSRTPGTMSVRWALQGKIVGAECPCPCSFPWEVFTYKCMSISRILYRSENFLYVSISSCFMN